MARRILFNDQRKILREIYHHYIDLQDYFSRTSQHTITHGPITISLFDLQYGLDSLPERRKEAFYLHVIRDMTQAEAGRIMGITPVTVGQYVQEALDALTERYFAGDDIEAWENTFFYDEENDRYVRRTSNEDTSELKECE